MASLIILKLKKTVPEQFHHQVESIFETSLEYTETNSKDYERNPKRIHRSSAVSSTETPPKEEDNDHEVKASNLAIAMVMMQLWSPSMFRYAENLILREAVREKFIEEKDFRFICVFNEDAEESDAIDWVIQDQDDVIIDLVWNTFNLKTHFDGVHIHRTLIKKSYERLKTSLADLHPEIIERHDLSKYAFSQAIGYTLKFIHKSSHPIWKAACDLHLKQEPHHPQAWSKTISSEAKLQMVKKWLQVSEENHGGCVYGIDISNLNLENGYLPLPFLLESYVDMVAIEWERKKGKSEMISNSELVYMEEKFLMRYNNEQRKNIFDFVNLVISSDKSLRNVILSEREQTLMKTIPEKDRGPVLFRIENCKRQELKRQQKKFAGSESLGNKDIPKDVLDKASDFSFYYNIALVIMEVWDPNYRKFIESSILRKAIKDDFIEENHLQWIYFAEEPEGTLENPINISSYKIKEHEDVVKLIWEEYKMKDHFSQMKDHRFWLKKSYQRLSKFLPELPEEVIERHDLSKFAFSQAVGYTLRWVHDINSPVWTKACDLHLNKEPHHPQMWQTHHGPSYKSKCLEAFLCFQSGGNNYGLVLSDLDLTSESMAGIFLQESFLDMIAVEWERKKGKDDDLNYTELVYMEERHLNRYCLKDKEYVMSLIEKVRAADNIE
ncbi:uncharacterized protein [Palaemon carinicauda]|uniref:uncharacterized protein n=1 Tax=Palaemon carinicauda TaxID=392227 RepID=UPI0035B657DE